MILEKWCRSEPPKKSFRRSLKRGTPDLSFQMQVRVSKLSLTWRRFEQVNASCFQLELNLAS